MSGVNIEVRRTGFLVKFGVLEFWFDSSLENLRRFFDVYEGSDSAIQEKLWETQKKAELIDFSEESIDDSDKESVNTVLDLHKEVLAVQYDIVLGEGSFQKIYEKYPDIIALEQAFDPLCTAIAERIESQEKERTELIERRKQEYLDKKILKRESNEVK